MLSVSVLVTYLLFKLQVIPGDSYAIDSWSLLSTTMPYSDKNPHVAYNEDSFYSDCIWVLGGNDIDDVYCFNMTNETFSNVWLTLDDSTGMQAQFGAPSSFIQSDGTTDLLYYTSINGGVFEINLNSKTQTLLTSALDDEGFGMPCFMEHPDDPDLFLMVDTHQSIDNFAVYNKSTNTHTNGTYLAQAVYRSTCAIVNGYFYVFGGWTDVIQKLDVSSTDINELTSSSNTWEIVGSMNTLLNDASCDMNNRYQYVEASQIFVWDNIVYIIGGFDSLSFPDYDRACIIAFDPSDESLSYVDDFPIGISRFGLAVAGKGSNKKVYTFGGCTGNCNELNRVYKSNGLGTFTPSSFPSNTPTALPSAAPTDMPTNAPTDSPTYYECDYDNDDLIFSWDEAFLDDISWESNINLTQGISDDGTFEVKVNVISKYIVGATWDAYSSLYESFFNSGYLGVTYVLDTNEFLSEGRLLSNANTCENRQSNSFNNKDFLSDYWDYTLYPAIPGNLGNDNYLEYGNQNIWNIELLNDVTESECGMIKWTNTFSFYDLWNLCYDNVNGEPSHSIVETDDEIIVNLNFYLTVVSPNPLHLMACNNGTVDCGQYLVKTLISHPLSIVFTRRQSIISNKDDVSIDLFTSNIIGAVYTEADISDGVNNATAKFVLTLITSVPFYMSLDISSAVIVSPDENTLELQNGLISDNYFSNYYISEETTSYMTDNCLIETQYRCFQKFLINIDINKCPSDGSGLIFDHSYYFSANYFCNGISNQDACDEYSSDEALSITLDPVELEYTELCDETVYNIDWSGEISFYGDESYSSTEDLFAFGDTIYTRITLLGDSVSNYQLFSVNVKQCYICTSNISNSDTITQLENCLSSYVDTSLFYTMPDDDDLDFTILNVNENGTDFSFTLPTVADNIFYVDCTVELVLGDTSSSSSRRTRMLLQNDDVTTGNRYENYVATAKTSSVTPRNNGNNNNNNKDSNNEDSLGAKGIAVIVIGCIIVLLLLIIVGLILNNKKQSQSNKSVLGVKASVEFVGAGNNNKNGNNNNNNNGTSVNVDPTTNAQPPMKIKKSSDGIGVYTTV